VIGPVAGGFICENLGWRWNFWIIAIAAAVIMTGCILVMKETYAPALLHRKTLRLRKETGNQALRSRLDNGMTTKELFLYSIVRPSKMLLFSPVCLSQSLYVAIIYSYLYLMFTTVTEIFETQYHFRSDLVGLAYVGMGLGSLIGQFGFTYYENRNYARHQRRGDLRPEHRLYSMVPGALILPVSLFWYGWSVQAQVHWMCPIIAMAFLGVALLLIFVSLISFGTAWPLH
jgi:MFS family permease